MKKNTKIGLIILGVLLVFWVILTLWVEYSGEEKTIFIGNKDANLTALIVYNPDPIYNLDEKVCLAFANAVSGHGFYTKIATIKAAQQDLSKYDCYVFCANTYNWSPDRSIKKYIQNHLLLKNSNVVAITLGSGSTAHSRQILENLIVNKSAKLIHSESIWLLKPNDETRMEEDNVDVGMEKAVKMGHEVGEYLNNKVNFHVK